VITKKTDATVEHLHIFSRDDVNPVEFNRVLEVARSLQAYIVSEETSSKIAAANVLGKSSHEVQECVAVHASELGFHSEKQGLFRLYKTANLRPDYYMALANRRGIILEVERGKTLANNMDLLDLWKCHICEEAQYLFLMVPLVRPNEKGGVTHIFTKVAERLEPFFRKHNYVNVYGAVVFGY
jgi:hypothetical protein